MFLLNSLIAIFFVITFAGNLSAQEVINGAGATFPYPLYSQWAYRYNQITKVKVNYQSIGSGGGIRQIQAKTVDFGASDAPLTVLELETHGLTQFPMALGGVVPVYNIKGLKTGQIKLDGSILAQIFLGEIKKWNDPAIISLNPDLKLPDKAITVVHRADGSGTTWIFVNYLSAVSQKWAEKVGIGSAVSWPTGVGGKGNEGVASYVQRVDGAIGYVEYAYALQNKMNSVQMKNHDGNFVQPTIETFMAAAANAEWENAPGFYMVLVNQPGENSWPITGATFILIHKEQPSAQHAKAMLDYFDWCFKFGQDIAKELHYVPLPENVVNIIEHKWIELIKNNHQPIWNK